MSYVSWQQSPVNPGMSRCLLPRIAAQPMIAPPLQQQLEPIGRSYRQLRLWRSLMICWLTAGALGLLLLLLGWLAGWWSSTSLPLLASVAAVAGLLAWWRSRALAPDFHWIADQIERRDPHLRTLLLTAVEQQPDVTTGQFGYLQQRVIDEALEHNHQHPWHRHIADQLFFVQCGHHLSAIVLVMVLAGMALLAPPATLKGTGGLLASGVSVAPGDTAIERGNGLVVMARFAGALPAEATLVVGATPETSQRIPLVKNLDDPVFGGSVPQVNADLLYHLEYGSRRTRDFRVTVFDHPDLLRADARLEYPAYTSLPKKEIEDTRRVSAIQGTRLEYRFQLNKPVKTAQLVGRDKSVVLLTPDNTRSNVYATTMTLDQSQRYELQLVDADGRANKVPPVIQIDVHANRAPELKLVSPRRDIRASPLEEIHFQAEVSDDFGLRTYGLAYTLGDAETKFVELGKQTAPQEKAKAQHLLPLESLSAKTDQLLSYFIWADDVGPDGQVRRMFGDMYFAEVRPFEEIFREGQAPEGESGEQRQGNKATKLSELQKQIVVATWKLLRQETGAKPSEKFQKDAPVVKESQELALAQAQELKEKAEDARTQGLVERAEKEMEKALKHLAEAVEKNSVKPLTPALAAEKAASQALLALAAREHQVVRNRNRRGGAGEGGENQRQLDQLEMKQAENRYETQRQASAQQNPEQREQLQVLNRLKELAQRQQDLNERIKELQNVLQAAQTEAEREEARRQLKRLRDEQQQMLADLDELRQRMARPENQSNMAGAREQLDRTRNDVRRASEELGKGQASQALAAGARAQRDLQQMQEDFRKKTSSQFADEMREMRAEARQLAKTEENIARKLDDLAQSKRKTLSDSGERKEITEELKQQKQGLNNLLSDMRQVTEQAEAAEPLLAKQLYDTLRQSDQGKLTNSLDNAAEMLKRSFLAEAGQFEERARKGIDDLKKGVEHAAESVLGDEAAALRLARKEIEDLASQLERELAQADPQATNRMARAAGARGQPELPPEQKGKEPSAEARGGRQTGKKGKAESGAPAGQSSEKSREMAQNERGRQTGQGAQPQERMEGQQPGEADRQFPQRAGAQGRSQSGQRDGQTKQPGQEQASANQPGQSQGQGQEKSDQRGGSQQASTQDGSPQRGAEANQRGGRGGNRDTAARGGEWNFLDGRGGSGPHGPLTGNEYLVWSDRLRDVEEMVNSPELRRDVARIRDRARTERFEFKRHSKEPQWDLVRTQILKPLIEVRNRISEELARMESNDSLVPIDRDPVPPEFADKVRRYYEKLGGAEARVSLPAAKP